MGLTHASTGESRMAVAAFVLPLVATSVFIGASPASASYYEDGVSFSGDIVRNELTYRLTVKAIRVMGSRPSLEVSVSRREEPGQASLRQTQEWSFDLAEEEFVEDDQGFHIDAGSNQEPLDVQLDIAPKEGDQCDEDQAMFVTRPAGGAFRIETGNEVFGSITELPECGRVWSVYSGQVPWVPCPTPGRVVQALGFMVRVRPNSERARISISDFGKREVMAGYEAPWRVSLSGKLPSDRLRLGRRLRGGFRVGTAPWLDGNASFRSLGPIRRNPWQQCGREGRREYRSAGRRISIEGDLTLDVIGYEPVAIKDPDALAQRFWVRPRR